MSDEGMQQVWLLPVCGCSRCCRTVEGGGSCRGYVLEVDPVQRPCRGVGWRVSDSDVQLVSDQAPACISVSSIDS